MTLEAVLSIVSSAASLITAIVIGIVQYRQGKRMELLAIRQEREELLNKEQRIKQQRDSFLIKYKNAKEEINLLPLCWVASIVDSAGTYHRDMYREYNMLEEDAQIAVCKYMNLCIPTPNVTGEKFLDKCISILIKLENSFENCGPGSNVFYDNAKYFRKCLTKYGGKRIQSEYSKRAATFDGCIERYVVNNLKYKNPIWEFNQSSGFGYADECIACEISAVIADGLTQHFSQHKVSDETAKFWIPGEYGAEEIDSLEDSFLRIILRIYMDYIVYGESSNDRFEWSNDQKV